MPVLSRLIATHCECWHHSSLVTHLRKMSSNRVDGSQIAREWAEWNALGLNASAEFRRKGLIARENVIDTDFYGFMDDPIAEVQKIYAAFDLSLSENTRDAMQAYLAVHSATQHGSHGYSFSDTGLDVEEERARLAPYQNFFNTRTEVI